MSNAIGFVYDDGKTLLKWEIGTKVDNAVWISVFLILVVLFNMVPVRVCLSWLLAWLSLSNLTSPGVW